MKIRTTKRPQLAPSKPGEPAVTYRGTAFNTIILRDEFRTVEMVSPGTFVGEWSGTCISCTIPSWIRRAGLRAYVVLSQKNKSCGSAQTL